MAKLTHVSLGLVAVLALFVAAHAEVFFEENFDGESIIFCAVYVLKTANSFSA
jgi:hypothetical protein